MDKMDNDITIRGVRAAGEIGIKKLGNFQEALILFSNEQGRNNKMKNDKTVDATQNSEELIKYQNAIHLMQEAYDSGDPEKLWDIFENTLAE